MITKTGVNIGLLCMAVFLSACTWVKLSSEAENVQVLSVQQVTSCRLLGHTTSMVKWTVASFKRDPEKVKTELETLARNSAFELGGNVIVAVSEIEEGKQKFDIYHCD